MKYILAILLALTFFAGVIGMAIGVWMYMQGFDPRMVAIPGFIFVVGSVVGMTLLYSMEEDA